MANLQAISAPYNFVPLSKDVHIPAWSRQVSHDWPFQDGYSGEIHYTLTAESPLLVGGKQQKATSDQPGRVSPFKLPDGRYAIPGSSLKGMLRSVVEIIGFGRMRMVDELRPGIRDISGQYVKQSYTEKVRDKVKTGFLETMPSGEKVIVPCKMVRLHHRDLEASTGESEPVFPQGNTVRKKHEKWQKICSARGWDAESVSFQENEGRVTLGEGSKKGFAVFTGQISDSTKKNGKKKDFLFYDPDPSRKISVQNSEWRDFLYIHDDEGGKQDTPWCGYWKEKLRRGEKMPVFYLQDRGVLRIGLAYMPKLAGDFTTRDCIAHVSSQHLDAPGVSEGGYDFADLLFGAVNGENQDDALRGRVSLEMAVMEGEAELEQHPETILNGPKPTYFPSYLEQPGDAGTGRLKNKQYATYMATKASPQPRLRGFKRYPARPEEDVRVQNLVGKQQGNMRVQVRLNTLGKSSTFKGRVQFHNLKSEELGILLWAMTLGGDAGLRHSLGMGKPFGFGQVTMRIDEKRSVLIPNDPAIAEKPLDAEVISSMLEKFEQYMAAESEVSDWAGSPQITALKAMADPESASELPHGMKLEHMRLYPEQKVNDFTDAKQGALILANHADATQWPGDATRARWRKIEAASAGGEIADSGLHPWIQEQLQTMLGETHATDLDALMRHNKLYKAWLALDEPDLKREIFAVIKVYWDDQGWWSEPLNKSMRKLRDNYERQAKRL